ncbi:hypothetical protein BKA62DRAFT_500572 [Auriculariales sp. MPI-PUGE-AT-0066]|nr:hypothetical protein BKA62DRAFT_500572 [Auriculariales sp. MPI-PUGE-AT-0066]
MPEKSPAEVVHSPGNVSGVRKTLHSIGRVFQRNKTPPAVATQEPVKAQEVATAAGAPESAPVGVKDEWSYNFLQSTLPSYALKFAPLVYLDQKEEFWPGSVIKHVLHAHPETDGGALIDIPEKGMDMLGNPLIRDNVAAYMIIDADPRKKEPQCIDQFTAKEGKPDASRRSASAAYIITADKSNEVGEGFVDVFYFYFYPFNYGGAILGVHMGNHVGDWEHNMIRFRFGVPVYLHMSAHSDGNTYPFNLLEKIDQRPVVYSARGSHAHYATIGTQRYSGIPGGPVDYTSKGHLWDPTLNYVSVNHTSSDGSWSAHKPWPKPQSPACEPLPTDVQTINILSFQGRWGNSFYEYRHRVQSKDASLLHRVGSTVTDIFDKVMKLVWGEGPTGPRDKSLNRQTVNRGNNTICDRL